MNINIMKFNVGLPFMLQGWGKAKMNIKNEQDPESIMVISR